MVHLLYETKSSLPFLSGIIYCFPVNLPASNARGSSVFRKSTPTIFSIGCTKLPGTNTPKLSFGDNTTSGPVVPNDAVVKFFRKSSVS